MPRFVKRRVDRIHLVAPASAWKYVNTSLNPADVGTRWQSVKKSGISTWLEGPKFLLDVGLVPGPPAEIVVKKTGITVDPLLVSARGGLDSLIETSRDLHTLKKRVAYFVAFKQYLWAIHKKLAFSVPVLNANKLDEAFIDIIRYVQQNRFGAAIDLLKNESPDAFESILKKLSAKTTCTEELRRLAELKTLRNLRPCADDELILRIDGRLENAELPVDAKHPRILPNRHPLTRLIVLDKHAESGHAGPSYTPVGAFHNTGDLRRDYHYNAALAHKFWLCWIKGYLPTLQGRNKWRVTHENLFVGQLVLVGDADDISKRGAYRLGRVHRVHPQMYKGREIVRRASIAVLKNSGSGDMEYVLRNISKIAPI